MSTKTPKLESTKDYSLFDIHMVNREIHNSENLEESMLAHGFRPSSPIHVTKGANGRLIIKRGHNRFAVAAKLNLPVYYIVDNDTLSIYEWERDSRVHWSALDFATSYAKAGNEHYQALIDFMREHGLPLRIAASLVGGETAGSGNKSRRLRNGSFKAASMKHANAVVNIIDACKRSGVDFATKGAFVAAVSKVLRVPEFDAEAFKARLALNPKMLTRRSNVADYIGEIEALYNYRAKGKRMPLALRVREVALEAQRTFGGNRNHNKED
jgi:hypothetical protein